MHRIRPSRAALAAPVAVLAVAALAVSGAGAAPGAVTVRVEGTTATLLPPTPGTLKSGAVDPDGVAAHACSGLTATGALDQAEHGRWSGTWSKSLKGYFITKIDGVAPSGARYWAFWVNDAPASQGICGYRPKPGDRLLFFVDCYGKKCPPNGGVLGIKAPPVATAGTATAVTVTAYADATGKPAPQAGAHLAGGGAAATTSSSGRASVTFAHAGRFLLHATAPHAVRAETYVCVKSATQNPCG
jgi:hypothetical protein